MQEEGGHPPRLECAPRSRPDPPDDLAWYPAVAFRHPRAAARFGRTGQGSGDRTAALRRGSDRRGPLCRCPGDAGRAPQPCDRHARPAGAARGDRARAAAPGGARDRGHPHPDPGGARGRAGPAGDPHRARRAPDHGPRGHPPPGGRDPGPADLAVPLRRYRGRVPRRGAGHRPAVCGQAGDVVLGQGPEHGARRGRYRPGLGLRADRWPRRCRALHRRGLHRFRLRNHPAYRAPRRRHRVLRADRPPAARRRLPRKLAAAGDVGHRAGARAGGGARDHR